MHFKYLMRATVTSNVRDCARDWAECNKQIITINGKKREVLPDVHFVNSVFTDFTIPEPGVVHVFETPTTGTSGEGHRIGEKTVWLGMAIRGRFRRAGDPSTPAIQTGHAALALFYDRGNQRATGFLPQLQDFYSNAFTPAIRMRNENNTERFRLIKRWDVVIVGATTQDMVLCMDDVPLNGLYTKWGEGNPTFPLCEYGCFYLVWMSDVDDSSDDAIRFDGIQTLYYMNQLPDPS